MMKHDEDFNFEIFFKPFHWKIWLTFHFLFLSYAFSLYFISILHKRSADSSRPRESFSLTESFSYFSLASLQLGPDKHPISTGGKVLQQSWSAFLLILVATYTANLAAILSEKNYIYPLKSIDEISNSNRKVGAFFRYKSQMESMENPILNELLSKERIEFFPFTPGNHNQDMENFKRGLESGYVWIENDANIGWFRKNLSLSSYTLDGYFSSFNYGFALRKDWKHNDNITNLFTKYSRNGLIDQITRKYKDDRFSKGDSAASKSLQLGTFSGMFLLMFSTSIVAISLTVLDLCWANRKKKKTSDNRVSKRGSNENADGPPWNTEILKS